MGISLMNQAFGTERVYRDACLYLIFVLIKDYDVCFVTESYDIYKVL